MLFLRMCGSVAIRQHRRHSPHSLSSRRSAHSPETTLVRSPETRTQFRGIFSSNQLLFSTTSPQTSDERLQASMADVMKTVSGGYKKWVPLTVVYGAFDAKTKRECVRPHKTLLAATRKVCGDVVEVSPDGLQVRLLHGLELELPTPGSSSTTEPQTPTHQKPSSPTPASASAPAVQRTAPEATPGQSPMNYNQFGAYTMSDFCFHVNLAEVPPPPAAIDPSPATRMATLQGDQQEGEAFSVQSMVSHIPWFFVPVSEVLDGLPGYTEEHVERYISASKGVQIVSPAGVKMIRIFGGYAHIDISSGEAVDSFRKYLPDPNLAQAFIDAFGGVTGRWMSLQMLLQRANPAAVARLPFQGPSSIVYFAQMQHLFAFAADGDGSVLLRPGMNKELDHSSSPTPLAAVTTLSRLPVDGKLDFVQFAQELPENVVRDALRVFPSIEEFIRSHTGLFYLADDSSIICRTRYHQRLREKSLSLEEQLQIAIDKQNKKHIRRLRRKLAIEANPDNPLLDKENLVLEILKFFPRKGHVSLKRIAERDRILPNELLSLMPKSMIKFFEGFPQHFHIYEYQRPSVWFVSRATNPLPAGVIRQTYTEEEAVAFMAQALQRRGSRSVTNIVLHSPKGVQSYVKKQHGGMYNFFRKYPQYFSLVQSQSVGNTEGSAIVSLIQAPTSIDTDEAFKGDDSSVAAEYVEEDGE